MKETILVRNKDHFDVYQWKHSTRVVTIIPDTSIVLFNNGFYRHYTLMPNKIHIGVSQNMTQFDWRDVYILHSGVIYQLDANTSSIVNFNPRVQSLIFMHMHSCYAFAACKDIIVHDESKSLGDMPKNSEKFRNISID